MKKEEIRENPDMEYLYLVKNPASNEVSVCACDLVIYPGTYVVAPSRYGLDMGIVIGEFTDPDKPYCPGCDRVCGCSTGSDDCDLAAFADYDGEAERRIVSITEIPEIEDGEEEPERNVKLPTLRAVEEGVDRIDRLATPEDMEKYYANLEAEDEAMQVCREKIAKHNLEMKLVTAHFLLAEPKVLFFFTSENRVDFRELVKDLVSVFRLRIELRQIGVRDEARVLGGLAVCGRDFCCHAVTDKLNPVTIKMAKEQNLSLNSMKISGPCGRLLCCLAYENDFYLEEKADYPYEGSRLRCGEELCKVTEVNILSRKITLSSPEGGMIIIPRKAVCYNGENNRWEITSAYQKEFFSNHS